MTLVGLAELDGAVYGWGDEFAPRGVYMANTWQGEFPWQNLLLDGYEGTSPVEAFPANGYGLHAVRRNLTIAELEGHRHPAIPRKVVKGGSHLCAPNYCLRYRPAARQGEAVDTSATHIGFLCIVREPTSTAS